MNCKFIRTPEKRKIIEKLNEQFGIKELPYLLLKVGKEKMRGFSGSLSLDDIYKLAEAANIEIIGLYIIKEEEGLRLSLDATHFFSKQLSKNVLELNDEQAKKWMQGENIEIKSERGVYAIKHKDDFLGCGKSNGEVVFNYVPKDRRIKK